MEVLKFVVDLIQGGLQPGEIRNGISATVGDLIQGVPVRDTRADGEHGLAAAGHEHIRKCVYPRRVVAVGDYYQVPVVDYAQRECVRKAIQSCNQRPVEIGRGTASRDAVYGRQQ